MNRNGLYSGPHTSVFSYFKKFSLIFFMGMVICPSFSYYFTLQGSVTAEVGHVEKQNKT